MRKRSADDHAHFALVPAVVEAGGVNPVLVGLPWTAGIVGVADKVAALWIVAIDEPHVVVGDFWREDAVDVEVGIPHGRPGERLISDDVVAGEQFAAHVFHRVAADVFADFGAAAVAVAVGSQRCWIDGAVAAVAVVRRADKAIGWIG